MAEQGQEQTSLKIGEPDTNLVPGSEVLPEKVEIDHSQLYV